MFQGVSDVPVVRHASQHVYSLFLKNGVKIYEYYGRKLHAKTVTIDGIYSSIGSFNLDPWSHFYNLEMNLTVLDPDTAERLEVCNCVCLYVWRVCVPCSRVCGACVSSCFSIQ